MSLTYPAKTQSENFVKEKESNASHLMKNSVKLIPVSNLDFTESFAII